MTPPASQPAAASWLGGGELLIWRTPAGPADIIGGSLERKRRSHTTPTVHKAQMLLKLREQGTVRLVFPAWMGRAGAGERAGALSSGCLLYACAEDQRLLLQAVFIYMLLFSPLRFGDGFNVFIIKTSLTVLF